MALTAEDPRCCMDHSPRYAEEVHEPLEGCVLLEGRVRRC